MRAAIITINKEGALLAERLKFDLEDADIFNGRMTRGGALRGLVKDIFDRYDGLIFIAALGITVRLINGLIKNKLQDPAVVSIDTAGRYAISALSGHEGGANMLAFLAAASIGAEPIITTGHECGKKVVLGIGTRRGVSADAVRKAIEKAVFKRGISPDEIRLVATIDLKKDEKGLIEACRDMKLPIRFFSKESLKHFKGRTTKSKITRRHLGLDGVCEPCALLAGRRAALILKKEVFDGVAIALAREDSALSE